MIFCAKTTLFKFIVLITKACGIRMVSTEKIFAGGDVRPILPAETYDRYCHKS